MADPYLVLLEPEEGGRFTAHVPDFGDHATCGDTFAEALAMAADLMAGLIEGLAEDGKPIPRPRPYEELVPSLHALDDWRGLVDVGSLHLVAPRYKPAPEEKPRALSISMLPSLVERIDTARGAAGLTRSGWLSRAAETMLGDDMPSHGRESPARKSVKRSN